MMWWSLGFVQEIARWVPMLQSATCGLVMATGFGVAVVPDVGVGVLGGGVAEEGEGAAVGGDVEGFAGDGKAGERV